MKIESNANAKCEMRNKVENERERERAVRCDIHIPIAHSYFSPDNHPVSGAADANANVVGGIALHRVALRV
jgi:hypothetical protein